MIPAPNLDDRTFEEIVEEAKRLIPRYCPEWTNFNPSDPGVTLVELFAWMTEMMLYRMNQVPDRNYLAFLELMGIKLQPPQPARTVLAFIVSETSDQVEIPKGSGFSTRGEAGSRPIAFETETDVVVVNNAIERIICQVHDVEAQRTLIEDYSEVALTEGAESFHPFGGSRAVDRYLYLGDSRLLNFGEDAILTVRFDCPEQGEREFQRMLEWEYFNGDHWRTLEESPVDVERRTIAFTGPQLIGETTVDEMETCWIRGKLADVPEESRETVVDTIVAKLEVVGEGLAPDKALVNVEGDLFLSRDLDKNFLPFDREPHIDTTFYLACDAILGQSDATIRIEVEISEPTVVDAPQPSGDLVLRWEYFNGKKWTTLGKTTGVGVSDSGRFALRDSTNAFSRSGAVEFARPGGMERTEVYGDKHWWVRCRLEKGDYGVPGNYETVDERWVWQDERPLRPPSVKSLTFKSSEQLRPFENVRLYNDWTFTDCTALAGTDSRPFQAFEPVPEESPSLFLGFRDKFPNQRCQVYFHVEDEGGRTGGGLMTGPDDAEMEQSVVWEYWTGRAWQSLLPEDGTRNFTQAGFVAFTGPKDHRRSKQFGDELFWLRARLEMGGYDVAPRVDRVLLNGVMASNVTTFRDTVLGSSQGTPNQRFRFVRGPILDGEEIVVREKEKPRGDVLARILSEEGADAVQSDPEREGHWLVRWHSVDSLYEGDGESRHYVKDVVSGEVLFGDGVHGAIPPKLDRNILARSYRVGGGEDGNVAPDMIRVMKQSIGYLDEVTNPFAASGGCDMETVEDVKLRGPHLIKSRNRAVTVEDFEWLAVEASNSVARVQAMSNPGAPGQVQVIVVPRVPRLEDGTPDLHVKPVPSTELLRRVLSYLDERRLLTTIVRVSRPRYAEMSIHVKIVRDSAGSSDRVKRAIDQNLRRFLNPLVGGRSGKGWPFGRSVYKVDLYHVIEEVEGVDFVDSVRIVDLENGISSEQLRLEDDQLVHLLDVEVEEIPRESIR